MGWMVSHGLDCVRWRDMGPTGAGLNATTRGGAKGLGEVTGALPTPPQPIHTIHSRHEDVTYPDKYVRPAELSACAKEGMTSREEGEVSLAGLGACGLESSAGESPHVRPRPALNG